MPKLECEVRNCAYNFARLCTKDGISVEGPASRRKRETSCHSFVPREIATYNYEFAKFGAESEENSEVWCDAIMCVYQQGDRCLADIIKIKVVGGFPSEKRNHTQKASSVDETMCQTFEYKES